MSVQSSTFDVGSSAPSGAVFLSYASQDADAAQKICEALRAGGVEVWFDKNELAGGDAWDQKIRGQVASCALFVPLISAATQARREGYFRIEWRLAAQRTHAMADGTPFLLPVVIDDTRDADALVPPEFKAVQWTRLPGGDTQQAAFFKRVQRILAGEIGVAGGGDPGGSSASSFPGRPGSPPPATVKDKGPSRLLAAAIVVVATLGLATKQWFDRRAATESVSPPATPAPAARPSTTTTSVVDEKSVAVLAFANLSEDRANEYFSDGISEELLNVLVKIPQLKVAARTSTFYFKGRETPLAEIARQLGVAYVVEGSVRKSGNKVRITAQLIKAQDGFQVWSDTFTREVQDLFAVQDEIAGLIAKNISPVLVPPKTAAKPALVAEAVQEYLAGTATYAKAGMANLREAVTHFERAVALEPDFAAAWIQLASAYTRLGRWGGLPSLQAWQAARAAIDRAQKLEPDSPEMLVALGWVLRTGEWDWKGAEQAFRRALALRPNQPEMMAGAAVLLFNVGKTEEAFELGRRAAQLDPLNPGTQIDLALMFSFSGNWLESERAARRALELAPNGTGFHSILSWALIRQQRYAEAEAEIARETDQVEVATATGLLALARGEQDVARQMIVRLEELAVTNPTSADLQHAIAWLNVRLGDKDRAFATLEKAVLSRDPSMAWLRNYADFSPIFPDPRWTALLKKVGLAEEQLR